MKVSRIFIYPIKSCGFIEVDRWPIDIYGLKYDRAWAIVDEKGVCLTQLKEPKLCLIRPQINLEKGVMVLNFAGKSLNIKIKNGITIFSGHNGDDM